MKIEIATLFTGVAVIIGACIAEGIIYAGLQKNSGNDKQAKIDVF